MRIILIFPLLVLALCIGCTRTAPEADNTPPPNEASDDDLHKPEPLVEPLVPRFDSPEETTPPEETTQVMANPLEKYAAEIVPLPPLDDLTAQVDEYVTKLGTNLESLEGSPQYASDTIVRDANALSLVTLAIGLAEADSKYKKSAPQMIAAAQKLAAAKSYEDGRKAYEELKSALTSSGGGTSLSWSVKIADLPPLMKAVPNLSSTVKRLTNTEGKLRNLRRPEQVHGALAALAAISQGSIANAADTTKPDAVEEWKKFCEELRDSALKTNAVARQFAEEKADYAAFKTAIDAMSVSCDRCHEVFYPSAVGKE